MKLETLSSRLVLLALAALLAGCERGRVVLSYPDTPPDLSGSVVGIDPSRRLLALRDSAGTERVVSVGGMASVARRVANLVTAVAPDAVEPGAMVEIWLAEAPAESTVAATAALPRIRRLIIVDLGDRYGDRFDPLRPVVPVTGAGAQPVP